MSFSFFNLFCLGKGYDKLITIVDVTLEDGEPRTVSASATSSAKCRRCCLGGPTGSARLVAQIVDLCQRNLDEVIF